MRPFTSHRIGAIFTAAVVAASLIVPSVRGDVGSLPTGSRVVIPRGAVLKVGNRIVDDGTASHLYTVGRTEGDWVWLTSGSIGGWARKGDVITLEHAIEAASAAIRRDPNAAWAHLNRGLLWHARGDQDRAIGDYSRALQLQPGSVPALVNRGNAWEARRDYDRAIADYDAALRVAPDHALALLNRGIARQAKGDHAGAVEDYGRAIQLGRETPQVYNNRGHARETLKDYDKAIADYDRAIQLGPKYMLSWLNRGKAWQAKGAYDKALADYEEATRLAPSSPWGYALRAWLLATCPDPKYRDGPRAVELAKRANELGGSGSTFLDEVLAAAYAASGDFDRAVEWQARVEDRARKRKEGETPAPARGDRLEAYREGKPYIVASGDLSGGFPSAIKTGVIAGAGAAAYAPPVPNRDAAIAGGGSLPPSFYNANSVLLPTGDNPNALPRTSSYNIGYTSPSPTYYTGNLPNSSPNSPVQPMPPASYGANYAEKELTTVNRPPSFYGQNYAGTASFNPGTMPSSFPTISSGTSFYGADYSNTVRFNAGTPSSVGAPMGGIPAPR